MSIGIERLKRLNANLEALLADPQPGLFTWSKALSDTLMEMSDYAGHGMVSAFPELLRASRKALNPHEHPNIHAELRAAIAKADGV